MNLLNGVGINSSKDRFSVAFFSGHGPQRDPLVALERGCLTTTPLATARAEEQRSGGGAFFLEFMNHASAGPCAGQCARPLLPMT